MRRVVTFLFPGLLLAILAGTAVAVDWPDEVRRTLEHIYPLTVGIAGLLLGLRLQRSRMVLAFVVLGAALAALLHAATLPPSSVRAGVLVRGIAILLPVNLVLLSVANERGVITPHGLTRLLSIGLQAAALLLIYAYPETHACRHVTRLLMALPESETLGLTGFAVMTALLALAALAVFYAHRHGPLESGFFWATALAVAATSSRADRLDQIILISTAGLVMIVGLIEASFRMAFRDELTGLPGRRALHDACMRLGTHTAVAMVDIDHFKTFNDRYGHDVGDQVLKFVASRLARAGGGGRAFRYGGEEFTVLFAGRDADHARDVMEQVRGQIAEWTFILRRGARPLGRASQRGHRPDSAAPQRRVHITISIGIAERSDTHYAADDIIRAADKALYRAKRLGRNRVCMG